MPAQRLDISFRLGITGSIRVNADTGTALADRLRNTLATLRQQVADCAASDALIGIRSEAPVRLLVVSPLAEGADRLLAKLAVDLQMEEALSGCTIQLQAALPFGRNDYEQTFGRDKSHEERAASLAIFRDLLAKAEGRVHELDGALTPDPVRHASYRAVGRTVVRNCDLLIVIEDPFQITKGPGGTREIANYAEQMGVPMLVFDGEGAAPPHWIGPAKGGEDAIAALQAYACQTLLPPTQPDHHDNEPWLIRLRRWGGVDTDPLPRFLDENDQHNFNIWRARDSILGGLTRHAGRKAGFEYVPNSGNHWLLRGYRRFKPARASSSLAAQLSTKYQQRYRTSYLSILIAAAVALIIAGFAVGGHIPKALTKFELGLLFFIGSLWLANEVMEWHQRYIGYRFLAELQRFTPYLMRVGRTAPHGRLDHAVTGPYRWVTWYYQSLVRAEGLKSMTADAAFKNDVRDEINVRLIKSQLEFHQRRLEECKGTHRVLGRWAISLFVVTFLCVFVKVVFHPPYVSYALAISALVLPILGAALFSLRAYEEFESLESQSQWLIPELQAAEARLAKIDIAEPLALQALGNETVKLVQLLLHDVSGWVQTFTVKPVEG